MTDLDSKKILDTIMWGVGRWHLGLWRYSMKTLQSWRHGLTFFPGEIYNHSKGLSQNILPKEQNTQVLFSAFLTHNIKPYIEDKTVYEASRCFIPRLRNWGTKKPHIYLLCVNNNLLWLELVCVFRVILINVIKLIDDIKDLTPLLCFPRFNFLAAFFT